MEADVHFSSKFDILLAIVTEDSEVFSAFDAPVLVHASIKADGTQYCIKEVFGSACLKIITVATCS